MAQQIDLVVVDDNKEFVDTLCSVMFAKQSVSKYYDPQVFLDNISKYPIDTRICLDNNFNNSNLNGIDLAIKLHKLGYRKLFLLSGKVMSDSMAPEYINIILKTDLDSIGQIPYL